MLASVFVTRFVAIVALTLSAAVPPHVAPLHPAPPKVASVARSHPLRAGDLYSLRARRRFATYLRMRLLELREERLDRAADAIERHLPPDVLLRP